MYTAIYAERVHSDKQNIFAAWIAKKVCVVC